MPGVSVRIKCRKMQDMFQKQLSVFGNFLETNVFESHRTAERGERDNTTLKMNGTL